MIEVLKQALEALEFFNETAICSADTGISNEAITSLRQAIAELESQEPVAYPEGDVVGPCICGSWPGGKCLKCPRITPPQRTEQEPVALPCCGYRDASAVKWNPLNAVVQCHNCGQTYTPPSQRKPLTDEECDDLWDMQVIHITDRVSAKQFIRDIEAAHGIKGDA